MADPLHLKRICHLRRHGNIGQLRDEPGCCKSVLKNALRSVQHCVMERLYQAHSVRASDSSTHFVASSTAIPCFFHFGKAADVFAATVRQQREFSPCDQGKQASVLGLWIPCKSICFFEPVAAKYRSSSDIMGGPFCRVMASSEWMPATMITCQLPNTHKRAACTCEFLGYHTLS